MLTERVTSLLTAYIDGELSSRKRRAVDRLLRKSSEARNLLHKMQQDSMILRHLPRRRMKADLSKTVLTTLDLRGIKLPQPPPMLLPLAGYRRGPRRWPLVVGALLLLVAIGTGSYFFFAMTAPQQRKAPPSTPAKVDAPVPDKSR